MADIPLTIPAGLDRGFEAVGMERYDKKRISG